MNAEKEVVSAAIADRIERMVRKAEQQLKQVQKNNLGLYPTPGHSQLRKLGYADISTGIYDSSGNADDILDQLKESLENLMRALIPDNFLIQEMTQNIIQNMKKVFQKAQSLLSTSNSSLFTKFNENKLFVDAIKEDLERQLTDTTGGASEYIQRIINILEAECQESPEHGISTSQLRLQLASDVKELQAMMGSSTTNLDAVKEEFQRKLVKLITSAETWNLIQCIRTFLNRESKKQVGNDIISQTEIEFVQELKEPNEEIDLSSKPDANTKQQEVMSSLDFNEQHANIDSSSLDTHREELQLKILDLINAIQTWSHVTCMYDNLKAQSEKLPINDTEIGISTTSPQDSKTLPEIKELQHKTGSSMETNVSINQEKTNSVMESAVSISQEETDSAMNSNVSINYHKALSVLDMKQIQQKSDSISIDKFASDVQVPQKETEITANFDISFRQHTTTLESHSQESLQQVVNGTTSRASVMDDETEINSLQKPLEVPVNTIESDVSLEQQAIEYIMEEDLCKGNSTTVSGVSVECS